MTPPTAAPYLVTLGFDPPTFERLDRLRARHFPSDRNVVPAHLALFHLLPGDEGEAIDRALAEVARSTGPIPLTFPNVKRTGGGLMALVEALGLVAVRSNLARAFSAWLTPQDRQPFHPHVTLMNKAERAEAASAFEEVRASWDPWAGIGERLLLWRYRGGPWEAVEGYDFVGHAVRPGPGASPSRIGG